MEKFFPIKQITIKQNDQPWLDSYTRLLLRKKNRNYGLFTKINASYLKSLNNPDCPQETVTRLNAKREKAEIKSKSSNTESKKANLRAKNAFFNTVNATMQNYEIYLILRIVGVCFWILWIKIRVIIYLFHFEFVNILHLYLDLYLRRWMWVPAVRGDLYFLIKSEAEAFGPTAIEARAPLEICISDSNLHPTHSTFE